MSANGIPTAISDAPTFLYLDLIADMLYRDTVELDVDFKQKLSLIIEQEQLCSKNATQIAAINRYIMDTKTMMLRMEIEIYEGEMNIKNCEKVIQGMENTWEQFGQLKNKDSKYLELLELLQLLQESFEKCKSLTDDMHLFQAQPQVQVTTGAVVCQIMDYHCQVLQSLETQIKALQSKSQDALKIYNDILEKVELDHHLKKCKGNKFPIFCPR